MKRFIIIGIFICSILAIGIGYSKQSRSDEAVSFSVFYNNLSQYGNWTFIQGYGYVWSPGGVEAGWRPYLYGRWVWSDDGWVWVSDEPWGWASYHYGRWIFSGRYGWLWMPGTTWAPAWVQWYRGPDYVGWTPLPPDRAFFRQDNMVYINHSYAVPPHECVFVKTGTFLSPRLNTVVIPQVRNRVIIRETTRIGGVKMINHRIINNGPGMHWIQRSTHIRIHKMQMVERYAKVNGHIRSGVHIDRVEGNHYYVFRPPVINRAGERPDVVRKFYYRPQQNNVWKAGPQNKYRSQRNDRYNAIPERQEHGGYNSGEKHYRKGHGNGRNN